MNPEIAVNVSHDEPMGSIVRTIIADDEQLARKKLRILLESEPDVEVVAECHMAGRPWAALALIGLICCFWIFRCRTWMAFRYWARYWLRRCR